MATLKERLDAELKDAMRAKDELKLSVLRMLKSAIKYKEVEGEKHVLDDAGVIGVITTLVKQRRDSASEFKAAGRPELAEKEEKEIAVLQTYLPAQLDASQLTEAVKGCILEAGAKTIKDLGAVMKIASAKLKGQAEGKAISEEVKAQLARLA
ncbi:MAG: GatB/YqeY domain-containing protein [Myxococcaceae bacterium]|nr:GatB/YqeY domain-containing protein [Myxococcaceae bacterium]